MGNVNSKANLKSSQRVPTNYNSYIHGPVDPNTNLMH
jgi:hypothetical protein